MSSVALTDLQKTPAGSGIGGVERLQLGNELLAAVSVSDVRPSTLSPDK